MPKRAIYIAIALLAVIFFIAEYTKDTNPYPSVPAIEDSTLVNTYPRLVDAVLSRQSSQIMPYTQHADSLVRAHAWRSLAGTPVDSMDAFITGVIKAGSPPAWLALASHPLGVKQLRQLERIWREQPSARMGISRVLGRQGDEGSLEFLVSRLADSVETGYEYRQALAVGRLMTNHPMDEERQRRVLRNAFDESGSDRTVRAYLYGYYRSDKQELSDSLESELYDLWKSYGLGRSALVDQYIARILPQRTLYEITLFYNSEKKLGRNIQLAVELAQNLDRVEPGDRLQLTASMLIHHDHPQVVTQALQNAEGHLKKGSSLYRYVRRELVGSERTGAFVWLQALESAAMINSELVDEHADRLRRLQESEPYLLPQILRIRQGSESAESHLQRLEGIIMQEQSLQTGYALRAVNSLWRSLSGEQQSELRNEVRALVYRALSMGDRGVTFAAEPLLGNSELFEAADYHRIRESLSGFQLPEDMEVYQAMGRIFSGPFQEQAQSYIDSLAGLGHPSLNRSLQQSGWEVEVPEAPAVKFRTPDWNTFWKLGRRPIWVLQTEKGTIKVALNTLSAPATVSAIDSLTRAGAYNGVPFHRVIPNFVIQGGDIERQDGLGGPDFVLPTEPSEEEYHRGAAGIASAGTDTEGSQYFIMHQWKPHLNGLYTRFGTVVEGMQVVDLIVVGDSVRVAYWQ